MRPIDADILKEAFIVNTDRKGNLVVGPEVIIDNAPTVERPIGEWIVKSNGTTNYYACDKCGSAGDIQDKFCRECGADMRKGEEEWIMK